MKGHRQQSRWGHCGWGINMATGLSRASSFTYTWTAAWLAVPRLSMYDRLNPVLPPTIRGMHPSTLYSYATLMKSVLKCLAISSSSQLSSHNAAYQSLRTAPASSQCLNITSNAVPIMMAGFASPVT